MGVARAAADEVVWGTTVCGGAPGVDYTHRGTGALLSCRFTQSPEYVAVNGAYYKVTLTLEMLP